MTSLRCLLSEASRGEGLGNPSPLLGCHYWQSCSVSTCCLLRRTFLDSSFSGYASVLCALLGLTADTVHVSFFGGFWLLFRTFPCEGGLRILRSILGRHGFSMSPSYSAVTGSVSLPREVYRKLWIYWEMTSGIFSVTGMLRSSVVARSCISLRSFSAPRIWQSLVRRCMLLRSA